MGQPEAAVRSDPLFGSFWSIEYTTCHPKDIALLYRLREEARYDELT
jgi:hypothetical protein